MRRIPLSHRSHVTGFQALGSGLAEHESALERDFVTLVSLDDVGARITAQPITLEFVHDRRRRRYTPDFHVAWSDGRVEIVEVKYRLDLKVQWPRLRPAFAVARTWTQARGARFRIVTERGIRGPRLDAAKRLLPLRRAPIDAALAAAAIEAADPPGVRFAELVGRLGLRREEGLALVWQLIAHGRLCVDLDRPITAESRIWVA